ncbi:MAG: hypothetical protein QF464_01450, partial [Myxococcota bacterium]|nr:hypothetical protein [Myxococcota bacterium]
TPDADEPTPDADEPTPDADEPTTDADEPTTDAVCEPVCPDVEGACGDDGCGNSCGECTTDGESCIEGVCGCEPHASLGCSEDGSMALVYDSCGEVQESQVCEADDDALTCFEGQCICEPFFGVLCGDDGDLWSTNGCGEPEDVVESCEQSCAEGACLPVTCVGDEDCAPGLHCDASICAPWSDACLAVSDQNLHSTMAVAEKAFMFLAQCLEETDKVISCVVDALGALALTEGCISCHAQAVACSQNQGSPCSTCLDDFNGEACQTCLADAGCEAAFEACSGLGDWGVGVTCTPQCEGMACGDNGCGGDCGACGEDEQCNEGACVIIGGSCSAADAEEAWTLLGSITVDLNLCLEGLEEVTPEDIIDCVVQLLGADEIPEPCATCYGEWVVCLAGTCGEACTQADEDACQNCLDDKCMPAHLECVYGIECTPSCEANTCEVADGCGGLCECAAGDLCFKDNCLEATGQCTAEGLNSANALLQDAEFTDAFTATCLSDEEDPEILGQCLTDTLTQTGIPEQCSACFGDFMTCRLGLCGDVCNNAGQTPEECDACSGQLCSGPFLECAYGLTCTPNCPADGCGATDGCGGTCGCPEGMVCAEGQCQEDQATACSEDDEAIASIPESLWTQLGPLCITNPDPGDCYVGKLVDEGMSEGCAWCHSSYVGCLVDNCIQPCFNAVTDACMACLEDAQCIPNFEVCATTPFTPCEPTCVEGQTCGGDGCGGNCGGCEGGQQCQDGECKNCFQDADGWVITGSVGTGNLGYTDDGHELFLMDGSGVDEESGAHDCSPNTAWQSLNAPPGAVMFGLITETYVSGLQIWNGGGLEGQLGAQDVTVSVGDSVEDMVVVFEGKLDIAQQCPITAQQITFPPVPGETVRIDIQNTWGAETVSLSEVRVYGFKPPNECEE